MREPGYYWVKLAKHLDFQIAYFDGVSWAFTRDNRWRAESSIAEIDERRIVREEPANGR